MYLLAKFGDNRFYRKKGINSYINSHMDTLEKTELTTSIRHIEKFLKSGISIYYFEVPDRAGRKMRRRKRTQVIAECYTFHTNAIKVNQNVANVKRN